MQPCFEIQKQVSTLQLERQNKQFKSAIQSELMGSSNTLATSDHKITQNKAFQSS